jgi:hypothetical protein
VLFVLLLAAVLAAGEGAAALNGIDGRLHALQVLGLIGAIGSLVVVFNAGQAWFWRPVPAMASAAAARSTSASSTLFSSVSSEPQIRPSRILETLIALACLGFAWFLVHWNVLNFSLHY